MRNLSTRGQGIKRTFFALLLSTETDYELEPEGRAAETAIPPIQPNGNMYTAYVDRGLKRLDKYEELRSRVDREQLSPELFVQMTPSVRSNTRGE